MRARVQTKVISSTGSCFLLAGEVLRSARVCSIKFMISAHLYLDSLWRRWGSSVEAAGRSPFVARDAKSTGSVGVNRPVRLRLRGLRQPRIYGGGAPAKRRSRPCPPAVPGRDKAAERTTFGG